MNYKIDDEDEIKNEIADLIGAIEMPNLIVENCDCSVCYEKTNIKTHCEHSLCYRCWSKLKEVDGSLPCPICREAIWCAKELDE